MKALILTNHLADFAGSEIVALEVAEAFKSAGCHVDIFANFVDEPMKSCMAEIGLLYRDSPPLPNPFQYDVVWSQHHVLSFLLTHTPIPESWLTYFVICSLSPFEPLEAPGWPIELADVVLANSPETAASLRAFGADKERISIFYNAAPSRFVVDAPRSGVLQRIMLVSNCLTEELGVAAERATNGGLETLHIGRRGIFERITPQHLTEVDAVVTTGKTVQYSILMGCPVYVYGRFGGPGWLTPLNLEAAEEKNFSGRCCNRKLTGEQICYEWMSLYGNALNSIRSTKTSRLSRYRLETYVDDILTAARNKRKSEHATFLSNGMNGFCHRAREGKLAEAIRCYYRKEQNAIRISRDLQFRLDAQQTVARKLGDKLARRERNIRELRSSISWRITAPLRALWTGAACLARNTRQALKHLGK